MSVITEVVVDHLLDDNIFRFNCHYHVGEQPRDVDTQGHIRDDLLDNVSLAKDIFFDIDIFQ